MTSPRIVVGMGVWNEERYLPDSIPSVLSQHGVDFRLVILDNGSTDGSWQYLRRIRDPRVSFLYSPTNLRDGVAGNFGWANAMRWFPDCQWFVGHGADDVMEQGYLAAILAAADANPRINLIFSPWRWIDHPERGEKRFPAWDPKTCHKELQIPGWRAFTRELWQTIGEENTEIGVGADWEWVVRGAVKDAIRPHQLDRAYLNLRVRTERKSQSELGDWPTMHAHMCKLMGTRSPAWAR